LQDIAKLIRDQDTHRKIVLVCRGVVDVKGKGKMTTYWVRDRAHVHDKRAQLEKHRKRHSQVDVRFHHDRTDASPAGGAQSLDNMPVGGRGRGKGSLSRKMSASFFHWFKDSAAGSENRTPGEAQSEEREAGDSVDIASRGDRSPANWDSTLGKLMPLSMSRTPQQDVDLEAGGLAAIAEDVKGSPSPELYFPSPDP